ncbi:hypothetical protein FMM05_07055 [Flavobacterium zepuense]|uniref:Uncharacterized protein n=1 Tax=Flavobacterium zepuense TaxID=2593302 RepID=A0A552V671_9FLAO|nr:hypothetical protein [Flavobacterium zepuense]TRW25973.1 hypothetical protein FMM05_07055 [Flavobacterium zepuense]
MKKSFYLPIHSMNLAHYLGSGIIAPSIYIENKNDDIQDRFKNYLLLSSSMFTKDTNCAIEIVLDSDEEATKQISENFHLFNMPLPISRIKNIYFSSDEQKIRTAQNISFGDAFIPERILKVSQEESIETKELNNLKYQSFDKNWSIYLKKYDQILGGFSTMKVSKEQIQNYPTHYFSALGNVNNLFSNILTQQNISIEDSFQFAFADEGKFKDFHNTIYSEIDYNEVERYAEKDNVNLEVKNGLIQIEKIPENKLTYYVAILESYGKGKRKQVDSFISDLISGKFVEKKKEGLSLIFGLNKGYKAFRNKYKTSNFEVDIKFHLDCKLDYYIIESVYQNVFNSLNSISSFKYIDDLFLENKKEEVINSKYITYQMIDKTIILEEIIATPFEKVLETISDIISKWFPFGVKKSEIETLFKADIELFKNSIERDLENRYKSKFEQNRVALDQLNNTIFENERRINQLENQLREKDHSKNETSINTYKPHTADIQTDSVQENNASIIDVNEDYSKENLEKLSMALLKKKAKELKIYKYSTYKKNTELITEILKLKSK